MSVKTGLEFWSEKEFKPLAGMRVGLIANAASLDSCFRSVARLLASSPAVELGCLMGPQHGLEGETQDNMIEWEGGGTTRFAVPVYSLYGRTRQPTVEMLQGLDAVVFDLQDAGARYFTFIHTMLLAMEACSRRDLEFVVLDRPNPINGVDVEGPLLDPDFSSFVGLRPLPIRHGMTVAELARYFNGEFEIGCRLRVAEMQGWRREMFFDQTGLPWVMPSPNLPSPETALVYAGMCLLEGTNVSEGRGTTRPFELSGAPWVQGKRLEALMEERKLEGVRFRAVRFIPTFHKWCGQAIEGVQIHVLNRRVFRPFRTGLELIRAYRRLGKARFCWLGPPYEYEFEKLPIDILCGSDRIRQGLERDADPLQLEQEWTPDLERFREIRKAYLLYP